MVRIGFFLFVFPDEWDQMDMKEGILMGSDELVHSFSLYGLCRSPKIRAGYLFCS